MERDGFVFRPLYFYLFEFQTRMDKKEGGHIGKESLLVRMRAKYVGKFVFSCNRRRQKRFCSYFILYTGITSGDETYIGSSKAVRLKNGRAALPQAGRWMCWKPYYMRMCCLLSTSAWTLYLCGRRRSWGANPDEHCACLPPQHSAAYTRWSALLWESMDRGNTYWQLGQAFSCAFWPLESAADCGACSSRAL